MNFPPQMPQPPTVQSDTILIVTQEPGMIRGRVAKMLPLIPPFSLQLAQIMGNLMKAGCDVENLGDHVGFDACLPAPPPKPENTDGETA